MILGLDISSNKTGVAILTDNGYLEYFDYIDTRTDTKAKKEKFDDLFAKVDFLVDELSKLFDKFPITEIHIEEPLSKFTPGRSSMHTLQTLFKVNYVVSYELRKLSGIDPVYWNPRSVVGKNGLKIEKGEDKKQKVFQFIKDQHPLFAACVINVKSKSSPWIDVSDAILIARAGFLNKPKLL